MVVCAVVVCAVVVCAVVVCAVVVCAVVVCAVVVCAVVVCAVVVCAVVVCAVVVCAVVVCAVVVCAVVVCAVVVCAVVVCAVVVCAVVVCAVVVCAVVVCAVVVCAWTWATRLCLCVGVLLINHVLQDKDRGMMAKQSSELPAGAEDGEGPVELTSIRSLSTGDDMDVTSDPTASPPASPADSEVKSPDSQLGSDKPPDEGAASAIGGEGEGGGERVQSTNKQEDEGVRERPKLDTQKSTQSALQRPESLEIDDQLAPNLSRMRKSNLRKSRPTPVNTGPTYTVTSPVGEPYDSSGQRRTRGSQECCCLM